MHCEAMKRRAHRGCGSQKEKPGCGWLRKAPLERTVLILDMMDEGKFARYRNTGRGFHVVGMFFRKAPLLL